MHISKFRLTKTLLIEELTLITIYSFIAPLLTVINVVNDFRVHSPGLLILNSQSTLGFITVFVTALKKCQLNSTLTHFISVF